MATADLSRQPTAPTKLACKKRNRTAKAAWWGAAERIDMLGDLISDIPYGTANGRAVILGLRAAALDLDRAIAELSAVKSITGVRS